MRRFWGALGLTAAFIGAALPVHAQNPIPFVNPQQLQIPATGADFNNLINSIDGVLGPLLPVSGATSTGVNVPGTNPAIGVSGTGNINLGIQPGGNGNLVLFNPANPTSTGVLKVANSAAWVPANALASCPGLLPNNEPPTLNGAPVAAKPGIVSGFWAIEDWAGRLRLVPTC